MTEKEWDTAQDLWDHFDVRYKNRDRERLRALSCACARRVLEVIDKLPHSSFLEVVEVAERYAGGRATRSELLAVRKLLRAAFKEMHPSTRFSALVETFAELTDDTLEGFEHMLMSAEKVLRKALGKGFQHEKRILSALLRDIFGNPFRPVAFDPAWRTFTAIGLAQTMYDSREFNAMPILADALQDAGCEDDVILSHCRDENGIHVRGCWVVDLVLGKQ
jgi:hypothetical protein